MDKAFAALESLTTSSPQLLIGYQQLPSDPPSINKEIDSDSSLVCPPPEPGCAKPVPNQPLVEKSVNLGSPPVDHSVSEERHAHVLLVSLDSLASENDSPFLANPESPSPVLGGQGEIIRFPHQLVWSSPSTGVI